MGKSALIVIDVQRALFEAEPAYDGEGLLSRLGGLIESARQAEVPVIYVQHDSGPEDVLEHGTPGWEIHPAVAPLPGELVVEKRTPNSFHETPLQAELAARGISELVLCGLQTDCCVGATTRGAAALGYAVTLVADGHSTSEWGGRSVPALIEEANRELSQFAKVTPIVELSWA